MSEHFETPMLPGMFAATVAFFDGPLCLHVFQRMMVNGDLVCDHCGHRTVPYKGDWLSELKGVY